VSAVDPASPEAFLPDIRARLAPFGFGSANFAALGTEQAAPLGEHLRLYRRLLPVSGEILPAVEEAVNQACARLGLPRPAVHAFVHPSADLNATCYSGIRGSAVIVLNAGMIECLQPEELAYVVGHELGHYLMPLPYGQRSIEDALRARELELTMDRFGLLACGDLKHAGSAILKIQSGLGSRHIRSDLAAFIQNGRTALDAEVQDHETRFTHPPEFVRLRALNAFVLSDVFRAALGRDGGQPIADINEGIRRDLDRAVDTRARELMEQALARLAQTLVSYLVSAKIKVESARFSRDGLTLDLERVRALAANWSVMPAAQRDEAFSKRLADHLPTVAEACPRRADAYLVAIAGEYPGTPIAEVCQGIRVGLQQARVAVRD
jgi:hypothetical protein